MKQETFFNYKRYRWLWLNLLLLAVCVSLFLFDDNEQNGGTVYGYTVGGIATAAILYLMWFGVRKRSYYAHHVPLKGWLAGHVWLGISLLALVPLHSAFNFGWNVHTLAYVIMSIVIVSGIWGAINYQILPKETLSNRGGGALNTVYEELQTYDRKIGTQIKNKTPAFVALVRGLDFEIKQGVWACLFTPPTSHLDEKKAAQYLAAIGADERSDALEVITCIGKKRASAARFEDEIRVRIKLRMWLLCHIPLSVVLIALVAIHILSVFYFK